MISSIVGGRVFEDERGKRREGKRGKGGGSVVVEWRIDVKRTGEINNTERVFL